MTAANDPYATGLAWEADTAKRRAGMADNRPSLPVPTGVVARPGRGQVTLDWDPVEGAVGYLVRRGASDAGPFEPLEIGEPWVRPVPHPPLTDTTLDPGVEVWYTVAAVSAVDDHQQPTSVPLAAMAAAAGAGECAISIHAATPAGVLHQPWRAMIGAERLSQLDHGFGAGDREIGREFATALRLAHDDLGVRAVRAHAILHDDLGVYREDVDGVAHHDFGGIDRIYDRLRELGLRPVVELSFMPRDLAADPAPTIFEYRGHISPPKSWERWERLVADLVAHLVERYGIDEVRTWGFEVWNEANLEVFWSGTADEYFRLYDVSARAIKSVDPSLPVGGPASAAVGWIDETMVAVEALGAPIDFVSTHCYGNAPLDLRPLVARYGHEGLPIWWTEWGAHATHFNRAHDSVWAGAYLVRGMVSAMGRIDALAYWTVSDHFEELGRGTELLHGGFGLLTVGNLRKPRWWGLWMLAQLAGDRLEVAVTGDGAGDMVNAIATSSVDGVVRIVAWNGTVDVSKSEGDPRLDRHVTFVVDGLRPARYHVRHRRVDAAHSDLNRTVARVVGDRRWPDEAGWESLRAADELEDLVAPEERSPDDGRIALEFDLPMPALSLVELTPIERCDDTGTATNRCSVRVLEFGGDAPRCVVR